MLLQGGWPAARLSQLKPQCLGSRRTLLTSNIQRVSIQYKILSTSQDFVSRPQTSLVTPLARRTYAQKPVSRPKAHTGRTTTAARKAPTTSKTKAAKEPAVKKTSPKAVPKTKSKAKPRIKPKPKPRKAKAKPKLKRKVLSEKQKAARATQHSKDQIKALKEEALLSTPKGLPATAWTVFSSEKFKSSTDTGGRSNLGSTVKALAPEFKKFEPERLEHYNHLANQNKAANETAYRKWIESYTPLEIHNANLARSKLKRKEKSTTLKKHPKKYSPLKDARQVKKALNAYVHFFAGRQNTGDFKGLKVSEAARLAGREWKALSAAEKKPYEDIHAKEKARYLQERKTVLNLDPSSPKKKKAATT